MIQAGVFLANPCYSLSEIVWGEDQHGAFWTAYLSDAATEHLLGRVGTYEMVDDKTLKRQDKKEQETELELWLSKLTNKSSSARTKASSEPSTK